MRRRSLIAAATLVLSLFALTSGAQALVLTVGGLKVGASLVPSTRPNSLPAGISVNPPGGPCTDPALTPDLGPLPASALCYQGGPVMHRNETFALTWDPYRRYWQTTRNYVEQFLRDVADGSGTLSSPYAVSGQYTDSSGRAQNRSLYGGGCIDYGVQGGYTCQFGNSSGTGSGNDYGPGCVPSGQDAVDLHADGSYGPGNNDLCITDAQIQAELKNLIPKTKLLGHLVSGYTPLVVVLTPPKVEVCVDGGQVLCSANSDPQVAPAQFCSYHSEVSVGGTEVAYLVEPWTPVTGCDDPDLAPIGPYLSSDQLATAVGARLVSPLSQSQLAAITDPHLNAWLNSSTADEIDDNGWLHDGNLSDPNNNGCQPLGDPGHPLDASPVGPHSYFLQREFNNGGALESDPNALTCEGLVALQPQFVVPSSVNRGDVVQFDGSTTISTLIVPRAGFHWSFGDGATAVGPSVEHAYSQSGTYQVVLTVTDRGGDVRSLAQTIDVLGPSNHPTPGLHVRLQLLPQGMGSMLRSGIHMLLSSNRRGDGFFTVLISAGAAQRAHISHSGHAAVVIGQGTIAGISTGTMKLHLRLSAAIVRKLKRLEHLTVTVRLSIDTTGGGHAAVVAAGRY